MANLTKYKIQTLKAGPLHAGVSGHTALLLESHLLQASQTKPRDNPLKRSLCSSGQACIFQIKLSWASDHNQKSSFHCATFPLIENQLQGIILLTKYYAIYILYIYRYIELVQQHMSLIQKSSERHAQFSLPLTGYTVVARGEVFKSAGISGMGKKNSSKILF